ncbi:UNVERIFIED_CONTAM: hypothetical protein FKN15_066067 [Acipenser sinensis]
MMYCDVAQEWLLLLQTIFIPTVFLGVLVVGLILNLLSLWIFFTRVKPWSRSTLFLCNLALADVTWLLMLPFLIQYHLGQRDWIFGEAMCKLNRTVYHSCFYCSIYFITCVSVDRYLAIVHPLKSISLLTRRQSLLVCLAVWVITSAVSYSVTQMATVQTCPDNRTVCSLYVFLNSTHESLPFSLVCTVTGCLGPFCAICYCYCSCVRQLRKQPHLSRWSQKRRKLAKVMYSALLIFGVLYLPYHLIRNLAIALQAADPGVLSPPVLRAEMAFAIEMAVCSLNTCINPLFYFLTGGDFRHHFFEMFPCLSGRVKPRQRPPGQNVQLHVGTIGPV